MPHENINAATQFFVRSSAFLNNRIHRHLWLECAKTGKGLCLLGGVRKHSPSDGFGLRGVPRTIPSVERLCLVVKPRFLNVVMAFRNSLQNLDAGQGPDLTIYAQNLNEIPVRLLDK